MVSERSSLKGFVVNLQHLHLRWWKCECDPLQANYQLHLPVVCKSKYYSETVCKHIHPLLVNTSCFRVTEHCIYDLPWWGDGKGCYSSQKIHVSPFQYDFQLCLGTNQLYHLWTCATHICPPAKIVVKDQNNSNKKKATPQARIKPKPNQTTGYMSRSTWW
jgi:hypothetical protein